MLRGYRRQDAEAAALPDDVVLRVESVSKKFCKTLRRSMAYGVWDLGRNMAGMPSDTTRLRSGEFWAVRDVSFELRRSETLGVIGENGSGKTTLLRLLSGIFPPDRGAIMRRGRVGALIAVGAGFHPYMTGRENVHLNGTILGMTRKELNERYEDIVNFAEIGDFIDAPVSTYSSGMRVRLGFAIAVHTRPDLLLVDEVLAVGDVAFRLKCRAILREVVDAGTAVIFVSHNLPQVMGVCAEALWLGEGRVLMTGDSDEVCRACESAAVTASEDGLGAVAGESEEADALITAISTLGSDGASRNEFERNESVRIRVQIRCAEPMDSLFLCMNLRGGPDIIYFANRFDITPCARRPGTSHVEVALPQGMLLDGLHSVTFSLARSLDWGSVIQRIRGAVSFRIVDSHSGMERGFVHLEPRVTVEAS